MSAANGEGCKMVKLLMEPASGRVVVEMILPREIVAVAVEGEEPAIVSLAVVSALLIGVEDDAPEPVKLVAASARGTLEHGMEAVATALAEHVAEVEP